MAAPYAESWSSRRNTPRSTSCSKSPRAGALLLNHIVGDITTQLLKHSPRASGADRRAGELATVCERSRTMRSNDVTLAILFAILVAPLRGEVIESTAAG